MIERFRKSYQYVQAHVAQFTNRGSFRGFRSNFRGHGRRSMERMPRRGYDRSHNEGRRNYEGQGGSQFNTTRLQCQLFDKIGHIATNCWYRYEVSRERHNSRPDSSKRSAPNANLNHVLATPATAYDLAWYPNFEATHHMSHDLSNLMEKIDYKGEEEVIIGDRLGLNINHVGNAYVKSDLSLLSLKNLCLIKMMIKHY
ncbi:Retrovirus-related Pol polyprotein [Arachis hypogaea]|nr:Retrovirus-related Pol polyprotein [Arachis hypogaea]